jgi:hypothetical protein
VFGGLNRPLVGALIAGAVIAVLAMPSAALACNGGTSAVNVYTECLPTGGGGGGKHTTGHGSKHASKPTQGSHTSSAPSTSSSPPAAHVSKKTAKVLKHAGKDKQALSNTLVAGTARLLQSSSSTPASAPAPTAIGSAFDLGSGPTALLIVLAGTALLLLGTSGLRGMRQRRR